MDSRENNSTDLNAQQVNEMGNASPIRRTEWSKVDLIIRILWGTIGRFLWLFVPGLRVPVLRGFGGKVGKGCTIARSVEIVIPWNITMGDNCQIREHAILYSLGEITLGDHVCIDARAHICAGSHDMRDSSFSLTRPPISIGSNSLIGVDAFIGPDVELGANVCVHPRASVYKSFGDDVELQGNPARSIQ